MKKIIHIAPALPPAVDGLGDFCSILADNLEKEGFTNNLFLIRHNVECPIDKRIESFTPRTFYEKLRHQTADVVILHYVGYAYHKKGMPFYIVNGLRRYKRQTGCRLLIFFHELYSSSDSLFNLAFYTNSIQKLIVKGLSDIADTVFTSCHTYRELLRNLLGQHRLHPVCTGIFSNVPDDLYDRHMPKEDDSIVVFGSLQKRNAVYHHQEFDALIKELGVRTLYDVGPGVSDCQLADVKVCRKGTLSSRALAACLGVAKFGALSYPPQLLAKSGIFSAYAAFGVIPFNLSMSDRPLYDGLVEGRNYLAWKHASAAQVFNYDTVRDELMKWYQTHNQKRIAETFKSYL